MGWLLKLYIGNNQSYLRLFKLFSIGMIHSKESNARVLGLMFGIWNFQFQLTLAHRKLSLGKTYEA